MPTSEEITYWIEGKKLISIRGERNTYPSRIVIPEGVEEIEQRFHYSCHKAEEIILPNSLKKIDRYAFMGCERLTSIIIPENVTEIGDYAFASCKALKSLTLSKSAKIIGRYAFKWDESLNIIVPPENEIFTFQDGLLFSKDQSKLLMYVNRENDEIVVPDGVLSIEAGAFEASHSRKSITRISLPSSLRIICGDAFRDCDGLTEIEIPNSVMQIGESVFDGCVSLTRVKIPNRITEISSAMFRNCKNLKEIQLPKKLRTIGEKAFKGCTSLSKLTITSKEIEILVDAFKYCSGLEEVIFPPVTRSIGNGAFLGCTSLAKVRGNLSSVEYCGHRAFQQTPWLNQLKEASDGPVCVDGVLLAAPDLEEVIVPKTVRMIAGGAFHMKKTLKRVTIPESVESIGPNAFSACRNLETIVLSRGLKRIERNAFRRCSAIKSIHIPDTVQYIGDYAFLGCCRLARVVFDGGQLIFGKSVFTSPWREITMDELAREKRENPPLTEAVANNMPANITIRIFGVGAALGFCRAALAGTSFSEINVIAYEKYLKRNRRTFLESPEKYEQAIVYMHNKDLL